MFWGRALRRERLEPERLIEEAGDWRSGGAVVDRDENRVAGVALVGRESRNGYEYSEEALKAGASLYEGRPVFLDHAPTGKKPQSRSARDFVGTVRNVRYAEGRIRGDIEVVDTESGRTFLALAESRSSNVGMSHVVLARRSGDRRIVEKIEEVISVDAVMFPATTQSLMEQSGAEEERLLSHSYEAVLSEMDRLLGEECSRIGTWDSWVTSVRDGDIYELRGWEFDETGQVYLSDEVRSISLDALESGTWRNELGKGVGSREMEQHRQRKTFNGFEALVELVEDESLSEELLEERERWEKRVMESRPRSVGRRVRQEGASDAVFVSAVRRSGR